MNVFSTLLARDLKLAIRQSADSLTVVAYFAIATVQIPFGVGPETNVLERISGGVLWVTALLAALLSLDRIFTVDYEDGTLDQLVLTGQPLSIVVLAKITAHWLTTGVPLLIVSPLLAVTLHLPTAGYAPLLLALLLGTPTVSLVGAVGAALVLGTRRGGVLLSLLVLPLYIPVLIFGAMAVEAATTGRSATPELLVLAGFAVLAVTLCPWATAAAVRQAVE